MSIQVGDTIPSIEVSCGTPADKFNMAEFCSGKKVLLFAVPGAFTPGCSITHLPGYIQHRVQHEQHRDVSERGGTVQVAAGGQP